MMNKQYQYDQTNKTRSFAFHILANKFISTLSNQIQQLNGGDALS